MKEIYSVDNHHVDPEKLQEDADFAYELHIDRLADEAERKEDYYEQSMQPEYIKGVYE